MDRVGRATRSRMMRGVRTAGTAPERLLARELVRLGMEPRLNVRGVTGTPDLAFPGARVAVFVHGCFWHGCAEHYAEPRTRVAYWRAKLEANRRRDRRVAADLVLQGWTPMTVWECQVAHDARGCAEAVAAVHRRAALRTAGVLP